ncbi:unnamed protein product [Rotaria socialis]|uniref:Ubiquitin-like domain-containing protein n=1 Tax=Rotaria socialis TaxID=392032 RepID=A0A818R2H8_9BILA|nr:unnamed protein product [Rotaria socialis]CAF4525105.1 unnamed protein product [Rotaria socialis]
MGSKSSPSDVINLKLILVSGKTAEFQFRAMTTASDVAKYVFEKWPENWGDEERVDRYDVLRLIYQGRFLHGNVTLGALRFQQGKTIVMHLVPRENLPEPADGDHKRKYKHENNQDRTADHSPNALSSHRSDTASPNPATAGCCERCTIA